MAQISRQAFDMYRDMLQRARTHASEAARDAIDQLDWSSPGTIKANKSRIINAITPIIGTHAEMYVEALIQFGNISTRAGSADASSDFDKAAQAAFEQGPEIDVDALESTIDYNAQKLEAGNYTGFRDAIADHTGMYTKKVAYELLGKGFALSSELTDRQSDTRVGDRGIEIAWVPSGDTCAFCIALASRGWQPARYEKFGDYAKHVHGKCDCELVFRTDSSMQIEGYDVDELRAIYYDREILPEEYRDLPDDEIPWKVRVNAIRRAQYKSRKNGNTIREQHREQFAANASARAQAIARALEIGINPGRAHRDDYDTYEEYEIARDKIRAERHAFTERKNSYIDYLTAKGERISKQDALQWAEHWNVSIDDDVFSSIDPRVLNDVIRQNTILFEKYPQYMRWLDIDGSKYRISLIDDGDTALMRAPYGGLELNSSAMEDYRVANKNYIDGITANESRPGINRALRGNAVGDGELTTSITHEFGHSLDFTIRNGMRTETQREYWSELTELTKQYSTSDYSFTNELEAFAEGFAEYEGNPHSQYGEAFGKFLDRWLPYADNYEPLPIEELTGF